MHVYFSSILYAISMLLKMATCQLTALEHVLTLESLNLMNFTSKIMLEEKGTHKYSTINNVSNDHVDISCNQNVFSKCLNQL